MHQIEYRSPREDRHAERPYVPISEAQLSGAAFLIVMTLSYASLFVAFEGASGVRYTGRYDAVVQVGVGTALVVLWCCWLAAVAVLVATRKLRVAWLVTLLWAAVCASYLGYSVQHYLKVIDRFATPPSVGGR